jgi:hypothetical protein
MTDLRPEGKAAAHSRAWAPARARLHSTQPRPRCAPMTVITTREAAFK